MSELINNSLDRKAKLKKLILKLHEGESQETVRAELTEILSQVPYGDVVEVEQELISEGLPEEEVLKLCDIHSAVLHGKVDLTGAKEVPEGHPVDVMRKENVELKKVTAQIRALLEKIPASDEEDLAKELLGIRALFNQLFDVDKHYQRKEYLIFPYLESKGITGPPKVLWGKDDEIRELVKGAIELLKIDGISRKELLASADMVLLPAAQGIDDMVIKEEEILFPMSLDNISDGEWYEVAKQSIEIGFCLYDPQVEWRPEGVAEESINEIQQSGGHIQLPSGGFNVEELLAILNHLPVEITFVDRNDKVKYFSQGAERVFQRNRAILNRDVRLCHPPASAHIVDKIVEDFKNGKQDKAPFWINMGGKMIHIEYIALRNDKGEYLGTLEISHDVSYYRDIKGEQRILSYK